MAAPAAQPAAADDGPAEVRLARELRLHRFELEAHQQALRSPRVELEAAHGLFADLYELSPVAHLTTTSAGVVVELNGVAAALCDRSRASAVGLPLAAALGASTLLVDAHLLACVGAAHPVTAELDAAPPVGGQGRVQLTSRSVRGPAGERLCLIAVTDVSAMQRREDGLRLRAEGGMSLLAATSVDDVLQRLTRALVPGVADLCVLDLVGSTGELRRHAATCHVDPAKGTRLGDCERRWGGLPNVGFATLQALQTGRSQLLPVLAPAYFDSASVDGEHLTELIGLALRSWAVVTLIDPACGRPLGALRLARGGVRRSLDAVDVELAEEVAKAGAISLVSMRLRMQQEQDLAQSRQTATRALEDALRLLGGERTRSRDGVLAGDRVRAALAELTRRQPAAGHGSGDGSPANGRK